MLPKKTHQPKVPKNKQAAEKKGSAETVTELLGPEYLSGLLNPADFSTDQKSEQMEEDRSQINEQNPKCKRNCYNFYEQSQVGCMPCQMLPVSEDEQVEQHLQQTQIEKQTKKKRRFISRAKNDKLEKITVNLVAAAQQEQKIQAENNKKDKQGLTNKKNAKQFSCKCKKTHCLKSYCECFLNNLGCNQSCTCLDCANWVQAQATKKQKPKKTIQQNLIPIQKMLIGSCQCKKTNCMKKYCECYNLGKTCGDLCKCQGCKNFTQ